MEGVNSLRHVSMLQQGIATMLGALAVLGFWLGGSDPAWRCSWPESHQAAWPGRTLEGWGRDLMARLVGEWKSPIVFSMISIILRAT
jgi:hypothetical protein